LELELAVIKKLRPAKLTSVVGVGGNRTATGKSGEMGERECGGRENHSAFVARTDFGSHSMTHQATLFSSAPAAFSPASHSLLGFTISAKKFAEKFCFCYLSGNKISVFFRNFRFENSKFKKIQPKFTEKFRFR